MCNSEQGGKQNRKSPLSDSWYENRGVTSGLFLTFKLCSRCGMNNSSYTFTDSRIWFTGAVKDAFKRLDDPVRTEGRTHSLEIKQAESGDQKLAVEFKKFQ